MRVMLDGAVHHRKREYNENLLIRNGCFYKPQTLEYMYYDKIALRDTVVFIDDNIVKLCYHNGEYWKTYKQLKN